MSAPLFSISQLGVEKVIGITEFVIAIGKGDGINILIGGIPIPAFFRIYLKPTVNAVPGYTCQGVPRKIIIPVYKLREGMVVQGI